MKKILKPIAVFLLVVAARAVVRRYRPQIVMVSGSVGKTSTKDAVASVLSARFFVRKSEKSFNSEFGVPFTILGVGNPWTNPFAWLSIVRSALALLLLPNHYPNMLVLETGADRPGDLARILKVATPDAVVLTRLPEISVHVEAYASPEAVQEEEFSPALALAPGAPLIVPADDPYARANASRTSANVITYSESDADVCVKDIDFHSVRGKVDGMGASVSLEEGSRKAIVKGSVGRTQMLPVAAAVALGSAFAIPLAESLRALKEYEPPAGRGRLLQGKEGSIIIDESYNSSPVAVEEALQTLKAFPGATRRIAVLGDMLELGRYSVMEHERIGKLAAESADLLVAVGIRARAFAAGAEESSTLLFDDSRAASTALLPLLKEGDVVLVKGSQSIRMERIVEALLQKGSDITKLVRQEKAWKGKK